MAKVYCLVHRSKEIFKRSFKIISPLQGVRFHVMKENFSQSNCSKARPCDLLAASNNSCSFDNLETYLLSQSSASAALCNISHLFFRATVLRMSWRVKKGLIGHKVLSNVKAGPGWPPIYSDCFDLICKVAASPGCEFYLQSMCQHWDMTCFTLHSSHLKDGN